SEEDLSRFLIPMAKSGREPMGSMGDDTPLAILSKQRRRLYDYFKQYFAQVTNPPIDPIRESFVTALFKYLGSEENLLSSEPRFNGAIRIESPILSPREYRLLTENHDWFPHAKIHCHLPVDMDFEARLQELTQASEQVVHDGNKILFLSDEGLQENVLPIPMALMVSAIHHHLSRKRIRSKVSLICLTGDVVADHHVACLIGMGASAVYPYMAYELIREHFADGDWPNHMSNYRYSLEKGLLKIMSKMGISTLTSYHGSMLFHGLGLSHELLQKYFPSIKCVIGGLGLAQIRLQLIDRNSHAFRQENPSLEKKGFFKFRKDGEAHGFAPSYFKQIQKMAAGNGIKTANNEKLVYLRDLLDYKKGQAVPLEQVEELSEILKRFGSGGISFGAISDESHRVLARGMHQLSARSNTGEGGEPQDRFAAGNPDKSANSYVKQVASGRFGVTVDYLAAAREIQIKMAQGAKPGEGGQLPGHKVSVEIANARSSTPGVPLISPPPHHDIYSIEDIAQLIYDLKQVNPRAKVSVKLVAQPGVGTVASGVAKAGADVILISGADGGTGASPLGSLKHAGLPWELGLPETHQALVANGLRSRVTLRVDGGLKDARDIIIAALLGAEEFDFGTSLLVAVGCVMARQCHLNTCPAGIATQDEKLQRRFKGKPEQVVNYLTSVGEQVQRQLSEMGFYGLADIVGRTDLLSIKGDLRDYVAEKGLDLSAILNPEAKRGLPLESQVKYQPTAVRKNRHLDELVMEETRPAMMTHGQAVVNKTVRNTDRSIGTRLSGELAFLYGRGNFNGSIQYRLTGTAGQSFGAFLIDGVELRLRGVANDYVGKGMSGGLITIRLPKEIRAQQKTQTVIGNVALYGATGGTLLVAGRSGERFAVRNSGASAVVEGVGNHGCEYMTRGTVVVLGEFGQNFGAGMTGGVAYIYCLAEDCLDNLNTDFVRTDSLAAADEGLVRNLLRQHHFRTGSIAADYILKDWNEEKNRFVKTIPKALDIIDFKKVYDQQVALRLGVVLNE
ncbi:MAG: glutamate synthase large subunit, partial [Anaerolineae bacterium]